MRRPSAGPAAPRGDGGRTGRGTRGRARSSQPLLCRRPGRAARAFGSWSSIGRRATVSVVGVLGPAPPDPTRLDVGALPPAGDQDEDRAHDDDPDRSGDIADPRDVAHDETEPLEVGVAEGRAGETNGAHLPHHEYGQHPDY